MLSRIKVSEQKLAKSHNFKEFFNSIKGLLQKSDSPNDLQVEFALKCLYS
jgi:hypothetical protein